MQIALNSEDRSRRHGHRDDDPLVLEIGVSAKSPIAPSGPFVIQNKYPKVEYDQEDGSARLDFPFSEELVIEDTAESTMTGAIHYSGNYLEVNSETEKSISDEYGITYSVKIPSYRIVHAEGKFPVTCRLYADPIGFK